MKSFTQKIKNVLKNKLKEGQQYILERIIRKKTLNLRKTKKSDLQRWKKRKEFLVDWQERTQIIKNMIPENSRIIEFGAGRMWLKKNLPPGCTYVGSDLVSHSPETLICDLNKTINIDLSRYDTAVFSGVLEYVYDIDKVFQQLEPFIKNIFLSYAISEISGTKRLERGWLSDFTKADLYPIFEKYGYDEVQCEEWRGQFIFHLKKKRRWK